MKNSKKLHVYIVHQFADLHHDIEHEILGVYLNREDADKHRDKVNKKGLCSFESDSVCTWLSYDVNPYIAVTKHTVRGKKSPLLGLINGIGE